MALCWAARSLFKGVSFPPGNSQVLNPTHRHHPPLPVPLSRLLLLAS